MTRRDRIEAALLGAYVADAAALGLHWLYDAGRVAAIAGDAPAFIAPDPALFEGCKGVFVHHGKRAGDLSHYGAHMRVAVESMLATGGRFNRGDFQDRFAAAFGPGGSWQGYIDKATKGTLANLAAGRRDPSGADDDQIPALAKLPPLMADADVTDAQVAAAVATTNANETALRWARPAAALLGSVNAGAPVAEAARAAAGHAEADIAEALAAAIGAEEGDSAVFAGIVGRACPLPQSLPVVFHIAARAQSYREAVERNILAGGDNCGRAPVIGAVFGAMHGVGGRGIPLDWMARLTDVSALTDGCVRLAGIAGTGPSP